ncbi:hypothetical protein CMI45_03435 [Candidatus Pacearchaeota archaeon]|nr:hypothetical protein [Candidatus Pacearchaeota archaeon]|tara:strand:+ start:3724 stop:4086 length:363 start_codon:yes stop_codon:yes gene_type:complete
MAHKSITDTLFEEDEKPFFMSNQRISEEGLRAEYLFDLSGDEPTPTGEKYLIYYQYPRGIKTVIEAYEILEESPKGYKVMKITDYRDLLRLDRIKGSLANNIGSRKFRKPQNRICTKDRK